MLKDLYRRALKDGLRAPSAEVFEALRAAARAKSEPAVPGLSELVAEAKALCDIDYCFGEADRQAKERRAWTLISKLSQLS